MNCPICNNSSNHHKNVQDYGEMRKCVSCGLIFANPMSLPEDPKSFFTKAYSGEIEIAQMTNFTNRIKMRDIAEELDLPASSLDPGKRKALEVIKENIPKESIILDIGCGNGAFLEALKREGYQPIGIDPSKVAIDRLKKKGYTVCHGTLDDIKQELPEPRLCTSFRVIHHSPDPVGFVRSIKKRFPKSLLFITDCGNEEREERRPPRHLTIWTQKSFKKLLEKNGYKNIKVDIAKLSYKDVSVKGIDFSSPITKIYGFKYLYRIYLKLKPIIFGPYLLISRSPEKNNHIYAFGKPK